MFLVRFEEKSYLYYILATECSKLPKSYYIYYYFTLLYNKLNAFCSNKMSETIPNLSTFVSSEMQK